MKKSLLVFLSILLFQFVHAQTDVTISISVLPPYSTYLPDYVNNPGRIMFNMVSNLGPADIKLKVFLTGDNGVSVITNSSYSPPVAIHLDQFVMVSMTGADLKNYLDINNVSVGGMNKTDLFKGSGLPEGNYTICIEAYDYTTGQLASQQAPAGCSNPFELKYLDPPQLIVPVCGDTIHQTSPQNIAFSWMPVPGAPSTVKYKFKMVELIPITRNPDEALNSATTPAFFERTTTITSLFYGPSDPLLLAGHKYAYKVIAFDEGSQSITHVTPPVHFVNNGASEACSFFYEGSVTFQLSGPQLQPGAIHLLSPADGATIKVTNNYGVMSYAFHWSGVTVKSGLHVYAYEMQDGQTAADAVKNNVPIPLTTTKNKANENDPGVAYVYFLNANDELKQGKKYAWNVQLDNGKHSEEIWTFRLTPPGKFDEVKITQFDFNGFPVIVDSVITHKPGFLKGFGRVYLFSDQMAGPVAKIAFEVELVNRTFDVKNGPGSWTVTMGTAEGDVKNFGSVNLYDKNYSGGDFSLTGKSIRLTSQKTGNYDSELKTYSVVSTPANEKSEIKSRITWITELVPVKGSQLNGGGDGENQNPATTVVIETPEGYLNFTHTKKFYGTLTDYKKQSFALKYPANFGLTISQVGLTVYEKEASAYIYGNLTVPDGRPDLDKDLKFDFIDTTGLHFDYKISGFSLPLNYFKPDGSKITTDLTFDSIHVDLCPGGGLMMNSYTTIVHLPGGDIKTVFHNGYNKGYGYFGQDGQASKGTYKMNTFTVATDNNYFKMAYSYFVSFQTTGQMQVPFLNQNAQVIYNVDVDGFGKGGVFFTNGTAATIYDNETSNDKLEVTPYAAALLDDRIVLDADFSFTNSKGKNVSLPMIHITQMYIKANGTVGWVNNPGGEHGYKYFTNQGIAGTFNGFAFKPYMLSIDFANNKYNFKLEGPLVLEETLATENDEVISIAYALPEKQIQNDEGTFTASADPDELILPEQLSGSQMNFSAGDVNTVASAISATAQNNGLMNFGSTGFTYFENDATFGSGFVANTNINVKNPFDGQIFGKIIVGRKDDYSYWFISGGQEGAQESPTGVLDIVMSGFSGRLYHHMYHKDGGGILQDDYIPWKKVGYGAYGDVTFKTKASNGSVFWAKGGIEVQTNNGGGLFPMTFQADGYILSSGVGNTNGVLSGHAFLSINPYPNKYVHGQITVAGNVLGFLKMSGTVDVYISPSEVHYFLGTPESQVNVTIAGTGTTVSGYYGMEYKSGVYREFASVSGYLFYMHPSWSGNIGYSPVDCDWEVGANAYLYGSVYAEVKIPLNGSGIPTMSGQVAVHAHAGIYGSLCGLDQGIGIGGTLTGEFIAPHPFCIAGSAELEMPSILPNLILPFRFKDGVPAFKSTCN